MKKVLIVCIVFVIVFMFTSCSKSWTGYRGTVENYEYCYESGDARKLEEDIIQLAENCLNNHPFLTDKELLAYDYYFKETWKNAYDASKRELFIEEINQIITDFPELSGNGLEVLYRVQKALAIIGDAHTQMGMVHESYFPFVVEFFNEDGKYNLYVVEIPSDYERLIFGQLLSINGISIDEILERFEAYQSSENKYWNMVLSTKDYSEFNISSRMMLQMVSVLDEGDQTADFEILKEDGTVEVVTLHAVSLSDIKNMQMSSQKAEENYSILKPELQNKIYWHYFDEETDLMYVRYAQCQESKDKKLFALIENVRKKAKDRDGVNKLVLDLRYNSGGRNVDGDTRLIDLLKDETFASVYVLINEWTFSQGHAIAALLNQEVERAVFVGSPTGLGSSSICCHNNVYFSEKNTGLSYRLADRWTQNDPDEHFDALYPDIYVYPTLSDYKMGIDTVLEAVKEFDDVNS